MPRASVIIPLYNLREFVAEAIESALVQSSSVPDVEVIVVDDGSTDGGGELARSYVPSIRYLRQPNAGLSAARNAGIGAARAPFLLFLDADDRLRAHALAAQLAVFDAHPDVGVVHVGLQCVDVAGVPLPQHGWFRAEGDVFRRLVRGNLVQLNSALIRREAAEGVGGFDVALSASADWDFWLRVSRPGLRWACVDEALAEYRIRPDAMHRNAAAMARDLVRVVDKLFADPTLPGDVRDLRPEAYQGAFLAAASHQYQAGDPRAAAESFRAAVRARPALVTETANLADFCRALLPIGYQTGTLMAAEWRRLAGTLRGALTAVFGPPPEPVVDGLRWSAEVAYWRVVLPLVRRRARTVLTRRRRQRLRTQRQRLQEFEGQRFNRTPNEHRAAS